jgi:uncharacterized protein
LTVTPQVHFVPHRNAPGVRLAVDEFAPATTPASHAIFLPGFGSVRRGEKATRLGAELPPRGVRFLALDFQGLGNSNGEFRTLTLSRQLSDYESARERLLPATRHVIVGSSMGGLVACLAAARDPARIAGLVLVAPAFGFRDRFERRIGPELLAQWERKGSLPYRGEFFEVDLAFDILRDARAIDETALVASLSQPVLVIHGDRDETVPIEESERAIAAMRAPVEFIRVAGGSHRLERHLDLLVDKIARFCATVG